MVAINKDTLTQRKQSVGFFNDIIFTASFFFSILAMQYILINVKQGRKHESISFKRC